jgi:hypothetical protein
MEVINIQTEDGRLSDVIVCDTNGGLDSLPFRCHLDTQMRKI